MYLADVSKDWNQNVYKEENRKNFPPYNGTLSLLYFPFNIMKVDDGVECVKYL